MTSRRGIFFNSRSRLNDKIPSLPAKTPPEDPSSSISNDVEPNIQITPLPSTTTTTTSSPPPPPTTTSVKKKIILNHTKRPLAKTNYSGPRKIFSTSYKVDLFFPPDQCIEHWSNLGESNTIESQSVLRWQYRWIWSRQSRTETIENNDSNTKKQNRTENICQSAADHMRRSRWNAKLYRWYGLLFDRYSTGQITCWSLSEVKEWSNLW